MRELLALAIAAALVGCSPQIEPRDSARAGREEGADSITGTIRIVGSAPVNVQVVLSPPGGGGIRLEGPLLNELRQLSGLEVTVTGRVSPSPDPLADRVLEATAYRIGLVNGRPVVVGEIVQISGGEAQLRTADGALVVLTGLPSELRVGQKVWVQGPSSLVVQSYGVLRP